jgi:hypothetical protein
MLFFHNPDYGDDNRVRGHGAPHLDGQNRRLLLLSLRNLILRPPSRESLL